MVINSRKDLGRLTRWSGPAADKATSVAKAIEIVLKNTEFIFVTEKMDMTGKVLKWRLHALTRKIEPINLEIRHDGKQWKVNVADIEAVLSLWLFAAAEKERTVAMDDKRDVDAWLRSGEASRGDSIRLLGKSNAISRRDMRWWAGSGNNRIIEVSSPSDDREIIELSSHRVVGYSGYKKGEDKKDERKKDCKCQYQIHTVSDDNNNMPENELFTRLKISINSMNEAAKRRNGISEGTSRQHDSMKSGIRPEYLGGTNQASTTKPKPD
ncbi:hypothetical protein P167DRAFT_413794 [Morchella conica CCBAS932]|uniref:Uncharacterized protein n=1 Tax=Morchella conica CCBAS932 TaxID=1392247 RepID=A0A3N4KNN4_9PEZI|nr:hypothetical protein P167DRAFT_413794 [Morchella conica CCBAS932]